MGREWVFRQRLVMMPSKRRSALLDTRVRSHFSMKINQRNGLNVKLIDFVRVFMLVIQLKTGRCSLFVLRFSNWINLNMNKSVFKSNIILIIMTTVSGVRCMWNTPCVYFSCFIIIHIYFQITGLVKIVHNECSRSWLLARANHGTGHPFGSGIRHRLYRDKRKLLSLYSPLAAYQTDASPSLPATPVAPTPPQSHRRVSVSVSIAGVEFDGIAIGIKAFAFINKKETCNSTNNITE